MDEDTLIKYAYVMVSSYRVKAVRSLREDFKTPSKIADEAGIRRNHISKVLTELKDKGIAECINEEAYRGRLYRLTELGEEIAEHVDDEII